MGTTRTTAIWILAGGLLVGAAACSSSNSSDPTSAPSTSLAGTVAASAGGPVAGATVYLIPAGMIDMTPITAPGVLAGTTEGFDEPLEDLVAAAGAGFTQANTDATGAYRIDNVPDGRFFLFVLPGMADTEHFPGGDLCRSSYLESELRGVTRDIKMSSSPTATATYVGMTICIQCHEEQETEKTLAHRLGFRVPGVSSPLQDTSEHPEIDDGLALFMDAADYLGGTPVYHYDYDPSRGFDEFKTVLEDPTPGGGVVYAILWLWRDTADQTYKITIDNVGNAGDPNDLTEREVVLTYGGAVYKQRYMISWPGLIGEPDLNGLYPLLQYQTAGSDTKFDRTRKSFRDYHLDFYWDDGGDPLNPANDLIAAPSITRNIQRNCMGCHATGYTQFTDPVTSEVLCSSVEDVGGEFDIDGNGKLNDLNTSCESCHGPGSDHFRNVATDPGRWIVSPENITASREVMLCNRCHDRQIGNGTVKNDHPLNAMDEFPMPGISRSEFLTDYVTRKGPASSSFWPDFEHSKSHHQQTPDFVKSAHYRNPYELVTCWSCHDMHGGTGYEHGLVEDPDAPDSPLCMNCHGSWITNTTEHTQEHLGVAHGSFSAKCVDCHMAKTAKTGAGDFGLVTAPPTGTGADADTAYYENDVTSHVFDVIPKTNIGVKGVQPIKAMPVPYTNQCGLCHDPSSLPFYGVRWC
jgi:predicted CXXCH cytochrome family protein